MQLVSAPLTKEAKKDFQFKAKHKNPEGGLSEAGRKAYNRATGGNLKRPQPEGGARRDSFCARMKGMKAKLTSAETARDPDSRINKSLRKWKCSYDMSEVKEAASKAPSLRMSIIYPNDDFTPESYALTVDSQRILNPEVNIITTQDYQDFLDDPKYLAKLLNMPGVREALESKNKQHQKEASKPGLWANIHAKRKRGEPAAKPGDADYPDSKNWKKVTEESDKEARCWKGYEPVPGKKPLTKGSCRPISAGKPKADKKASALNVQQFMGQRNRRELTDEEKQEIEKRKKKLLPAFFTNLSDSPATGIYSPLLPTLGAGAAGGLLGAALGGPIIAALRGKKPGVFGMPDMTGESIAGGALGAGLGGLLAYLDKQRDNANIEETMRRIPENGNLRDYLADPLIQENKYDGMRNALLALMATKR